ncbi:MAG TPA: CRISPR-associated protein Cas4 [Mycobacteriales bacterium]
MALNPDDLSEAGRISVPLSALEHHAYCPRQAALIHVEQVWTESGDTARGDLAHRAVDLPGSRRRTGIRVIRSLPVWSDAHGLHGICDIVEITKDLAVPVEYKVGRYKPGGPADVQLAGQAICLRDMGMRVEHGYVYSVSERRRHEVVVNDALVDRALATAEEFRATLTSDRLPLAVNDRRCRRCSLREDCLPELTRRTAHPRMSRLFDPMEAALQ